MTQPSASWVSAWRTRLDLGLRWAPRLVDAAVLGWLGTALLVVCLGGLAASLAPLALKTLVDHLASTGGRPVGSSPLPAVMALLTYVGALLFQRLCEQVQALAYATGEQRLIRRLNNQAFAHILTLPLGVHLDGKSGGFFQTLAEGVAGARLILTHLVISIAPMLVQILVVGGVLAVVLGPSLGLALFAALWAYGAVFAWSVSRISAAARGVSAAQIDVGGVTADGLMNIEAIKTYQAEDRYVRRHDALLSAAERRWRVVFDRRLQNGLAVAGVFALALGGVLGLAIFAVAGGAMSLGAFVMVNTYVLQLIRPLEMLGFAVRDIGQGQAYLERLFDLLARPAEAAAAATLGGETARGAGPAALAFETVAFEVAGKTILSEISFSIRPGARVALVGPSGAGKSSLLRLVLRLFEPTAGTIRLDGAALDSLPLARVRDQVALVSQDTILLNDTIAENIALGREGADRAAILAAARAARLGPLLDRLPDGLDSRVGERGLKLSGGEKQRVAIARAALKGARLVIFDEATAALDPETEQAVWAGMAGLSGKATCLIVTHRLSALAGVDEILVLDAGRIVERGDHPALLAADGLYARLWRAQEAETARRGLGRGDIGPLAAAGSA